MIDLSATPFFLSGSGYVEGTLFPWTLSDFSLMDAIECGIVKLPRVPGRRQHLRRGDADVPQPLGAHRQEDAEEGPGQGRRLDPLSLPPQLQTALEALYGHYEKTFKLWQDAGVRVPPCFIVVCQNTAISKLVYDYISGFTKTNEDGSTTFENGRLALFRNFDEHGNPLARPNTLLIDSEQLESGEALDDNFRKMASDEIERFRREIIERTGDPQPGREPHRPGPAARGDEHRRQARAARRVDPLRGLGVDAHRGLGREHGHPRPRRPGVRHAAAVRAGGRPRAAPAVVRPERTTGSSTSSTPTSSASPSTSRRSRSIAPPQPPRETIHVKAVRPERDHLEIRFPRVVGYRVELPEERLTAQFNDDSLLELTPDLVGATTTQNSGIIGERVDLTLKHTGDVRPSQVVYELTSHLVLTKWQDADGDPQLHLFGQLKRIARQWLDDYLVCKGGTYPAQLKYKMLADMACASGSRRRSRAPTSASGRSRPCSTRTTRSARRCTSTSTRRRRTAGRPTPPLPRQLGRPRQRLGGRVLPRGGEHPARVAPTSRTTTSGSRCRTATAPRARTYLPDFIVLVDDGHGDDDLLHLVVEIKGYRGEDAKEKKSTMETYWVPGVNNLGRVRALGVRRVHRRLRRSRPTSRPRSKAPSTT